MLSGANYQALAKAIPIVFSISEEQMEKEMKPLLDAIGASIQRHFKGLVGTSSYNAWLNSATDQIENAASAQNVMKMQAQGLATVVKNAAIQMHQKIDVPDENLEYNPESRHEHAERRDSKKLSSRVQAWFDYIQSLGGYRDYVRGQSRG